MPICDYCGEDFEAKRSDARYCSAGCRKASSRVTDSDVTANVTDSEGPVVTATDGRKTPVADNPVALRREADRLQRLQVKERGTVPGPTLEGVKTVIPGPYVPTPEREGRANQILSLRKRAARLEFPISHSHTTPVKVSNA